MTLALSACKSSETKGLPSDSKVIRRDSRPLAPDTRLSLRDAGSVDSDTTPSGLVDCYQPKHLASNLLPDLKVACGVNAWMVAPSVVEGLLKSSFTLVQLPERTPIAGGWAPVKSEEGRVEFKPTNALTVGREYLVHVAPQPLLQVNREYILFHIGSHPRLAQVQFAATSGLLSDKADLVGLTFSEYIDTQSAYAGVTIRKKGESKALALTPIAGTAAQGPSIGFTLAGGFDEQAEYVIEVAQTITTKAGVMIDTDYDGTPGGGQMVITLRPGDYNHKTKRAWVPPVSF